MTLPTVKAARDTPLLLKVNQTKKEDKHQTFLPGLFMYFECLVAVL